MSQRDVGADCRRVPRDILRRFTCRPDGEVVFTAQLFPAVSANPYVALELVELELYLASRAAGMNVESPAVRP